MMPKYDAVANHVFGGAMLCGFKRTGLNVKADLETFDIGVKTVKLNFPDVEVRQDAGARNWRLADFQGIDILFGNPRCTAFSTLTVGLDHRHGAEGAATVDIRQAFGVANAIRPRIFCLESVQGCNTTGRGLIEKMAAELPDEYRFAVVLINNATFNVSQNRKRLFIVGYRGMNFSPKPPTRPEKTVLTGDVIRDLEHITAGEFKGPECNLFHFIENDGVPLANHYVFNGIVPSKCDHNCKSIQPGTCIYDLDPREADETLRGKREKGIGLSFHCIKRAAYDQIAPLIYSASANWLHPKLHRSITIREAARMFGVPDDYWYVGHSQYAQVGNGVSPNTSEWIAKRLISALDGNDEDTECVWNEKKNDVDIVPANGKKWKLFQFTKMLPRDFKEVEGRRKALVKEVAAWRETDYGKVIEKAMVKRFAERREKNLRGLLGTQKESTFNTGHGLVNIGETDA